MSEEIVNVKADVVEDEKDQMTELRKAAHEFIDKCDGFLLIPYKITEIEQNGQKTQVSKSMIPNTGVIGGGAVNLSHASKKCAELLQMENNARAEQVARLAE